MKEDMKRLDFERPNTRSLEPNISPLVGQQCSVSSKPSSPLSLLSGEGEQHDQAHKASISLQNRSHYRQTEHEEIRYRQIERPLIQLLPTGRWNEEREKESGSPSPHRSPESFIHVLRNSKMDRSVTEVSPEQESSLEKNDILQVQVNELEDEVANLAEQLHAAHAETDAANAQSEMLRSRNEHLERTLEEEMTKSHGMSQRILDLTHKVAQLQAELCCKSMLTEVNQRERLARGILLREYMRRVIARWRLETSPHLSLLRKYAQSNQVRIEKLLPLEAAMVLAECGQIAVMHLLGWRLRRYRSVLRQWRVAAEARRRRLFKINFVCRQFVGTDLDTKENSMSRWQELVQARHEKKRLLTFFRHKTAAIFDMTEKSCCMEWTRLRTDVKVQTFSSCSLYMRAGARATFFLWRDHLKAHMHI